MLRRSQLSLSISSFSDPCLPRVLNRVTPGRLEATLIFLKERRKRLVYQGSQFMHFSDRMQMFVSQGGVRKGTRYIVEPHHNRAQFHHPGAFKGQYDIRSVKTQNTQHDMIGGYTRTAWDLSICSTNAFQDGSLKRHFKNISKQEAIDRVESWGVRYILLDEIRKPRLQDCKYHRHNLYADNFYWTPFPETNHRIGDAEYKWRGNEEIGYGDYGAATASPRNQFRSLWHKLSASGDSQKPAAAAAAPKATAKA